MTDAKKSAALELERSLANKTVPFKFMGHELRFTLSHALFSSFDIDAGTKLLLKTIAQRSALNRAQSLLDLGCGVGVLAVCVKKYKPEMEVWAADRDALALTFTARNAAANGIRLTAGERGFRVLGSLGLRQLPDRAFDLVVSNLPAKAGAPVLASLITGLSGVVSPDGLFAFVIVNTLIDLAERVLAEAGYQIAFREATREHTVCHARPTRAALPDRGLDAYVRGSMKPRGLKRPAVMRTVFGLPEFDTLSYATQQLRKLLDDFDFSGSVLIWNPGQGYAPLFLESRFPRRLSFTLAGRDLLSLEAARANCLAVGVDESRLALSHAASLFEAEGTFDSLVILPDADPGVPWYRFFLASVRDRLQPGGTVFAAAKSSFWGRIDFADSGVRLLKDIRAKGFRAIAFQESKAKHA